MATTYHPSVTRLEEVHEARLGTSQRGRLEEAYDRQSQAYDSERFTRLGEDRRAGAMASRRVAASIFAELSREVRPDYPDTAERLMELARAERANAEELSASLQATYRRLESTGTTG